MRLTNLSHNLIEVSISPKRLNFNKVRDCQQFINNQNLFNRIFISQFLSYIIFLKFVANWLRLKDEL